MHLKNAKHMLKNSYGMPRTCELLDRVLFEKKKQNCFEYYN